jgi:hypothetical protein
MGVLIILDLLTNGGIAVGYNPSLILPNGIHNLLTVKI